MRLTVLGSGAACPPAGQNSSGYLVETPGRRVLVDCGHGVASALLEQRPAFDIDDIVISHMHADHFIEVIALRFRITREMAGQALHPVGLHLPPGGRATLRTIVGALGFPPDFCETAFDVHEYDPTATLALGPLSVRFAPAAHYIPAFGVRLDAPGDAALVYSGDTAPSDALVALCADADLFLCEAANDTPETGPVRGHCTPEEAAGMAADARVAHLVLSHFWSRVQQDAAPARAAPVFRGRISAAHDGLVIDF